MRQTKYIKAVFGLIFGVFRWLGQTLRDSLGADEDEEIDEALFEENYDGGFYLDGEMTMAIYKIAVMSLHSPQYIIEKSLRRTISENTDTIMRFDVEYGEGVEKIENDLKIVRRVQAGLHGAYNERKRR